MVDRFENFRGKSSGKKMTYELVIPNTPKSWNAFKGKSHWAYWAYRQEIFKTILTLGRQHFRHVDPLSRVRITFICGYHTKRRSDVDSLVWKPHIDALVALRLLEDDHKEIVREVTVTWEKTKKPQTKILIQELEET